MKRHVSPWKPEAGQKYELITVGNVNVKVYRRERETLKGGKRWIYEIADYTGGARRLRGLGKLEKARAEAKKIAERLAAGDVEAAMMRGSQAASYGRAVELIRPTGASLEMAAAVYAKCFEILGGEYHVEAAKFFQQHGADKITKRTVAEVVTELIQNRRSGGKSRRYINDLNARLMRFAESFAVEISTVTTADVQGWLDKLKLAPRTTKNFRGALSTLFSFAESRGYAVKGGNPVTDTEKISGNGDGPIEIYTPEEICKLLRNAPRDFLPFVALGAFAGLRSAEIERLEWREIGLAGGFIRVSADKAKTRSRRLVPVMSNLIQWLAPYSRRRGKVWTGSERDLLDARAETVKAAETPWKDNALRHSFISYRMADIQDAAKVALEAGNSPQVIFTNYRELVTPAEAKTWFAIAPEAPANVVPLGKASI